jgi:penicillin-binding protein 1C
MLAYWFCLPSPLFDDPTCMVLEDSEGNLLGARIAADGQWRFPHNEHVPEKFRKAIVEFEDHRFYSHFGVDPVGIGRAFKQNIKAGKIVSGGSTLSMQVLRISRKGKPRSVFQKIIEIILATRLEIKYSKNEILAFYASNAPFGGNVVGIDAASWRYFGKNPELLSWAEAATLAVLPNSPALIHPGRNRQTLLEKRNRLLDRLLEKGEINSLTCELAKEELLPEKPLPLPQLAPHLLGRAFVEYFKSKKNQKTRFRSTINSALQKHVNRILENHHQRLKDNLINNIAAIVVEVESGNIIAYVGNVKSGAMHNESVDVIKAPRSTGSILKPFLYAMMLNEGKILPNSLVPDIPTRMNGYNPKNFHESYDGAVPAKKALIRSLNVPMVHMLSDYGLEKFHFGLQKLGFTTITKSANHYGLTLILGGAEAKLWDITNAYTGMARTLNHFYKNDGQYHSDDFRPLNYNFEKSTILSEKKLLKEALVLSAAAIWQTFDAMQDLERPNAEGNWQQFQSSSQIAWKTGTSFGFRDAWAVGVTPKYAVGVWVGNADGEGRPGLIGVLAAAPVLFDIFDELESSDWFEQPIDEMIKIPVCKKSGYRALDICETDSVWISKSGLNVAPCPFHKIIHLDASLSWQVSSDCENPSKMIHKPWFVLPPIEEYYYKTGNPDYSIIPAFRVDCKSNDLTDNPMQLIYPKDAARIYVPVGLNGKLSRTVFKVAHRKPETVIHWHLDNEYIGSTEQFHHFELQPSPGKHLLTLVDNDGFSLHQQFEIIEK